MNAPKKKPEDKWQKRRQRPRVPAVGISDSSIVVEQSLSDLEELVLGIYDDSQDPLEVAFILLFFEEVVEEWEKKEPGIRRPYRLYERIELVKKVVLSKASERVAQLLLRHGLHKIFSLNRSSSE